MESYAPILIIGMHRSGTSMITKLLGDNGLFLGDSHMLLGINPDYISDNPKGYWELKPAVELSERIINKLGGSWKQPPDNIGSTVFDKEGFEEEITQAREIFSPFETAKGPWGWKDPRNSLLIDFWKLIYPNLKLLICLRNPIEVAFSLSKRSIEHVGFNEGLRLWELYNQVIVKKMDQNRSLVTHYESYFYSPRKEIERVRDFIGINSPTNLRKDYDLNVIEPKLYRGMVPSNIDLGEIIPSEIQVLYETMCGYAGEVYENLSKDLDYQKEKNRTSSIQLITSGTNTFDEFFSKLEEKQAFADDSVRRLEILSNDFEVEKQRLLDDIEMMNKIQERISSEHKRIRGENLQLEVELNQIKNTKSWRFLNKFRPIYGKIYWSLAKLFNFGQKNAIHHHDPISAWIETRLANHEELEEQKAAIFMFEKQPLFSFITPVYDPPIEIFEELVQSILNQTYPNWELCLADGGTNLDVTKLIQRFSEQDPRIKFKKLSKNLGISGNSNEALALAEGEFIVICDHDDLIEPNLLFEAIKLINEIPQVDMIYYDEDKVDISGNHFSPFLKPATIAPDLLISINYLTHSIIRRKLIEEIGGFDPDADGAQDWDVFLKILEKTQNIFHIGKILYHWRSVESSAASGEHIKPYALEAQKRSIAGHLERIGLSGVDYEIKDHVRRVRWDFQKDKVTIILPVVDYSISRIELEKFQKKLDYPDCEILVIGNKFDSTIEVSDTANNVSVHRMDLPSSLEAYNIGAELAQGDYLFAGHPKMVPTAPDVLSELVMWMQKTDVGIVGSKLINRSTKKIKSFGKVFGLGGFIGDLFGGMDIDSYSFFGSTMNYYNVQVVALTGLLTDKRTFLESGGFSVDLHEEFAAINYCLRVLENGERIVVNPFAAFFVVPPIRQITYEDIIKAYSLVAQNQRFYQNFYNRNLSYLHIHPTLAETRDDFIDMDIETIFRRHYLNRDNIFD